MEGLSDKFKHKGSIRTDEEGRMIIVGDIIIDGNVIIEGDVLLTGNMTINGTLTSIDTRYITRDVSEKIS